MLSRYYAAWPFAEYGLLLALCYAVREALGDTIAFQAGDHMRHLQDIVHLMFDLAETREGFTDAGARDAWCSPAGSTRGRRRASGPPRCLAPLFGARASETIGSCLSRVLAGQLDLLTGLGLGGVIRRARPISPPAGPGRPGRSGSA